MNDKNIFKGDCYVCKKKKFITNVTSWSGQKSKPNGEWVKGGWRSVCDNCVKDLNLGRNRVPNSCGCGKKFIGSKSQNICPKCSGGKK